MSSREVSTGAASGCVKLIVAGDGSSRLLKSWKDLTWGSDKKISRSADQAGRISWYLDVYPGGQVDGLRVDRKRMNSVEEFFLAKLRKSD